MEFFLGYYKIHIFREIMTIFHTQRGCRNSGFTLQALQNLIRNMNNFEVQISFVRFQRHKTGVILQRNLLLISSSTQIVILTPLTLHFSSTFLKILLIYVQPRYFESYRSKEKERRHFLLEYKLTYTLILLVENQLFSSYSYIKMLFYPLNDIQFVRTYFGNFS